MTATLILVLCATVVYWVNRAHQFEACAKAWASDYMRLSREFHAAEAYRVQQRPIVSLRIDTFRNSEGMPVDDIVEPFWDDAVSEPVIEVAREAA